MHGCRALTTASNSKRYIRFKVQNQTNLVFELFGEETANESVENRANDAGALRLRQPTMLEASRHHRPRSTMPEPVRLRFDKRKALLYRAGIVREQAVTQRMQFSFAERL